MKTRKNPYEGQVDIDEVTPLVFPELPEPFFWERFDPTDADQEEDIDILSRNEKSQKQLVA
jgi:hypothetical protein